MNDHEKQKAKNPAFSMSQFAWIDNLFEVKEATDKSSIVKKGIPLGLALFWGIVGLVWFFKMISFFFFELPVHLPVSRQLHEIQTLERKQIYEKALKMHEELMAKHPSYKEVYYFNIAQCYFACGETNYNFKKGLVVLIRKELSEEQFFQLKNVASPSLKSLIPSFFGVWQGVETKERTYIFDHEKLGL